MALDPGPLAASQWPWQQQQQGYDCDTIAAAGAEVVPRSRPTAQMRPPCVSGSHDGATLMVLPPRTQPVMLPQQASVVSSLPVPPVVSSSNSGSACGYSVLGLVGTWAEVIVAETAAAGAVTTPWSPPAVSTVSAARCAYQQQAGPAATSSRGNHHHQHQQQQQQPSWDPPVASQQLFARANSGETSQLHAHASGTYDSGRFRDRPE